MPITFETKEVTYEMPIDETTTIKVRFAEYGAHNSRARLRAVYRGDVIEADTVQQIADQIQTAKEIAEQKTARANALKEMAKNPVPAMLAGKNLTPVLVRGVPQSQASYRNAVLITVVATGEKKRVEASNLLRELTDDEQAVYRAAVTKTLASFAALRERAGVRSYEITEDLDAVVSVRHDADTDEQVAVVDGVEFRSQNGYSLRVSVESYFAAKEYPYTVGSDDLVAATAGVGTGSKLFKTEADAQAYVDANAAHKQAEKERQALEKSFGFDVSTVQYKED